MVTEQKQNSKEKNRLIKKLNSEKTEICKNRTVKKQTCGKIKHNLSLAYIIIVNCVVS